MMRRTTQGLAVTAALMLAAGCSEMNRFHGFIPPQAELAQLETGISTKDQVISLFGPPTSERALLNNSIYYASSQFRRFGPFAPEEVDRQVLAVAFDADDRLENITRYGLQDGRVIVLDRRVTDDGIDDIGVLEQLFGSFGRIDAGTLLGEQP